jgi:hypothetical protein
MCWDRVFTVNDFWDRPRLGVANLDGKPHIYQSTFNPAADDFNEYYFVAPIDDALFELVMEDWAIWMRWSAAFDAGEATTETHPALPLDRERHEVLAGLIGSRLKAHEPARKFHGSFRGRGWDGLQVKWTNVTE